MKLQIRILAGVNQGDVFALERGRLLTVGRNIDSDIRLGDPAVSRSHCQIALQNDVITIRDMQSRGGVYVDGNRVAECSIEPYQVVQIASTQFHIEPVAIEDQDTIAPDGPAARHAAKAKPAALSRTKVGADAAKVARLPSDRLHELSGQKLSNYLIGDLLAKGQAGLVFEATNVDNNRQVALKVLYPEFSLHEKEVQRFIRTMKTVLPIRHVNLVRLFGAGRSGPYCWVAMEFVEGHSLAAVAARLPTGGKIAWKNVLRIAIYIARGLEYAHQQGIVHRNVTPRNILIGRRPDICKLSDLMLAKAMDGEMAEHVTTSGQLLGDVTCMSPERTSGDPDAMDERSDLYSLGASMYTVITGKPPFESKSPVKTLIMIRQQQPIPPRTLQPNLPQELEAIMLKMMAKNPDDRYPSATALRQAMENFADANNVDF